MNPSEAFKTARARWSSLPAQGAQTAVTKAPMGPDEIQEQDESDQRVLHLVANPEPPEIQHTHIEPSDPDLEAQDCLSSDAGPELRANVDNKATGEILSRMAQDNSQAQDSGAAPEQGNNTQAKDEILQRIAVALELIADRMSALSPSTACSSATNNTVQPPQNFSLTKAKIQTSASSGAKVFTPVTSQSSGSKAGAVSAPPYSMPSTSAEGYNNHGVLEMDKDSDDEVEPEKRCGVCRGPCDKMYALSCGHYPFCGTCVDGMAEKEASISYMFKCPFCMKIIKEYLELHIHDD